MHLFIRAQRILIYQATHAAKYSWDNNFFHSAAGKNLHDTFFTFPSHEHE